MRKVSFTSLPAKTTQLMRKKPLILIAISLILVGASIAAVAAPSKTSPTASPQTEDHKRELIGAVDTSVGMPQDGRDPAAQPQNSLASAASKPEGPGQRTAKPAANVTGSHDHHASPSTQDGVTSAGCVIGYGKPGEQCLPTPGKGKAVTCDYVHSKGFHDGLVVTGDDKYNLDKNNDKTACGHSD